MVLGFGEYEAPARRLAGQLGAAFAMVEVHRFPDGEHRIELPAELPEHLVVCRSLFRPNDKLVDLMLVARTARELGVTRLSLVAPYLCYMRQDKAFRKGEVVSQRIIGGWLAELFDDVVTVDAHLHRISSLAEVMPGIRTVSLTAAAPMAEHLQRHGIRDAVLLGPDSESRQWVAAIAELAGLSFDVASKQRMGDRSVRIALPATDFRGRPVILVDDMVSTGRTLIEAAGQLQQVGCGPVSCMVTHALLDYAAEAEMRAAGIERLISCDSVPHASNAIELAGLLAEAFATDKGARPC